MAVTQIEQILFTLHNRVTLSVAAVFDVRGRRAIGVVLLCLAVALFSIFAWLHIHYVGSWHTRQSCLVQELKSSIASAGGVDSFDLLRVRLVTRDNEWSLPLSASLQAGVKAGRAKVQPRRAAPAASSCGSSSPVSASSSSSSAPPSSAACMPRRELLAPAFGAFALAYCEAPLSASEAERHEAGVAAAKRAVVAVMPPELTAVCPAEAGGPAVAVSDASWRPFVEAVLGGEGELEALLAPPTPTPAPSPAADSGMCMSRPSDAPAKSSARRGAGSGGASKPAGPSPATPWTDEARVDAALRCLASKPIAGMVRKLLPLLQGGSNSTAASNTAASGEVAASSSRDAGVWTAPLQAASVLPLSLPPTYLFTLDRALLLLTPAKRDSLRAKRLDVTVDVGAGGTCAFNPISRFLLDTLVGYETLVVNAFIHAAEGRGFVSPQRGGSAPTTPAAALGAPGAGGNGASSSGAASSHIYALSQATEVERFSEGVLPFLLFKLGTGCSAVFLLFTVSSLVAFILGQTQQRMLRFTVALRHHIRTSQPFLPLVASHLLDSLVFVPIMLGVLFFLFEFFMDPLLAFMVLAAVWGCEIWSLVACRTLPTLRVFPRVFGLGMTFFLMYYLSYPFGYHYLALSATVFTLFTGTFHLWNTFELPALASGAVNAARPRHPIVASMMNAGDISEAGGLIGGAIIDGIGSVAQGVLHAGAVGVREAVAAVAASAGAGGGAGGGGVVVLPPEAAAGGGSGGAAPGAAGAPGGNVDALHPRYAGSSGAGATAAGGESLAAAEASLLASVAAAAARPLARAAAVGLEAARVRTEAALVALIPTLFQDMNMRMDGRANGGSGNSGGRVRVGSGVGLGGSGSPPLGGDNGDMSGRRVPPRAPGGPASGVPSTYLPSPPATPSRPPASVRTTSTMAAAAARPVAPGATAVPRLTIPSPVLVPSSPAPGTASSAASSSSGGSSTDITPLPPASPSAARLTLSSGGLLPATSASVSPSALSAAAVWASRSGLEGGYSPAPRHSDGSNLDRLLRELDAADNE